MAMGAPNNNNNPLIAALAALGKPQPQMMPSPLMSTDQPEGQMPSPMMPQQPAIQPLQPSPHPSIMKSSSSQSRQGPPVEPDTAMMNQLFVKQMAQRQAEVDRLNQERQGLAGQEKGFQDVNLKPLLAFTDGLNGTNSAASYAAPTHDAERRQRMQQLQDAISKQSGAIGDDQLAYMKNAISERKSDHQFQQMMGRNDYLNGRLTNMDDNLALKAGHELDNDPQVKSITSQLNQMAIDYHTVTDESIPLTVQRFNEIQKGIANAIAGGHSATVSDTAAMKMNSLDSDYKNSVQYLTGQPQDAVPPAMRKQLLGMITRLDDAYKQNLQDRIEIKQRGISRLSSEKAKSVAGDKFAGYSGGEGLGVQEKSPSQPMSREEFFKKNNL
jgi:hypothetical protein